MALISSKLMCLEPISKIGCNVLLRFSVATPAGTIPRCALESSMFHTNEKTNPYIVPASLFSTDSKRLKKKKQDDHSSSKHMNLPFEKKKGELYRDKHDKLILERVREKGYNNPETWKSLAIDFNMKRPDNIKGRCDLLLRRGSGERQKPKAYTKEEDALIVQKVEEGGYDNLDTWKMLAIELGRDPTLHFCNAIADWDFSSSILPEYSRILTGLGDEQICWPYWELKDVDFFFPNLFEGFLA